MFRIIASSVVLHLTFAFVNFVLIKRYHNLRNEVERWKVMYEFESNDLALRGSLFHRGYTEMHARVNYSFQTVPVCHDLRLATND